MLQSRAFIAEHNYHRRTLCSYFWRWRRLRLRFTKTCWGFTGGCSWRFSDSSRWRLDLQLNNIFSGPFIASSSFLSVAWLKWTRGRKDHMYNVQPFWGIGQSSHLVFPISPKNTNLVEDVEISLPVKFHWILFNRFKREVENASAHQRPGRPSCFSDRPPKNLVEDIEILFPVKFCWIPFSSFRGEVENVTAN